MKAISRGRLVPRNCCEQDGCKGASVGTCDACDRHACRIHLRRSGRRRDLCASCFYGTAAA